MRAGAVAVTLTLTLCHCFCLPSHAISLTYAVPKSKIKLLSSLHCLRELNYETNNKLPTEMPSSASSPTVIVKEDKDKSYSLLSKSGYKFWVLSAILLLASWSMFTGSLSLKWSSPDITRFSDHADFPVHDDLDILEVEERKQVVMRTWDAYAHGNSVRLPRFWLEAFAAAYEYLISDMPGVRDVAVSEIAKMSMHSINIDPLAVQSRSNKSGKKNSKLVEGSKKVTDGTS